MASSSSRKGKGRQKIRMEKIENESNLQATFSKRRNGVFKKAHELSILTGAEVAVIVFSPGGKVYSYGHPTVELVTDRLVTGNPRHMSLTEPLIQAQHNTYVDRMIANLNDIKSKIEYESARVVSLDNSLTGSQRWVGSDIDDQSLEQLKQSALTLRNLVAEFDNEIHSRALFALQTYGALPAGGYNYNGAGIEMSGLPLVGNGSNDLSVLPQGQLIVSNGGNGSGSLTFQMGPSGYGNGVSSSKVEPDQSRLRFYGNGGDSVGPSGAGPSSFAGVENGDGGFYPRVPDYDGSMPPGGFGGRY